MKCVHYYNFIRSGDGSPTLLSSRDGDKKLWPTLDTKEKKPTSKSYLCCSAAFTQIWQRLMYITLKWHTWKSYWHGTRVYYTDMEDVYITLTRNTCILHWQGTDEYYTDMEQVYITLTWHTWKSYWHGTRVYYTDMEEVYITLTRNTWILHWQGTDEYYTDMEHMNIILTWNMYITLTWSYLLISYWMLDRAISSKVHTGFISNWVHT